MELHDMTCVINIQTMEKKIKDANPVYPVRKFEELEKMDSDELHDLQDELIKTYNQIIFSNKEKE